MKTYESKLFSNAQIIFKAPKTFSAETQSNKAKLILEWILNDELSEDILNGNQKVQNIMFYLDKMKNHDYLRLFEDVDLGLIKRFLTTSSWILLQDFKKKHINDKWTCQKCNSFLKQNQKIWQCEKCLFWFHGKCMASQTIKDKNSVDETLMCFQCFFQTENIRNKSSIKRAI